MWHPMRNLALSGILVFQVVARVAGECGTINSTGYAGGTTAGVACAFPFTHLGKSYTDCTHAGSDRGAWCGIAGWGTGNAIEWGFCNASCSVYIESTAAPTAAKLVEESSGSESGAQTSESGISGTTIAALAVGAVVLVGVVGAVHHVRSSKRYVECSQPEPCHGRRTPFGSWPTRPYRTLTVIPVRAHRGSKTQSSKGGSTASQQGKAGEEDAIYDFAMNLEVHSADESVPAPTTEYDHGTRMVGERTSAGGVSDVLTIDDPLFGNAKGCATDRPVAAQQHSRKQPMAPSDLLDYLGTVVVPAQEGAVQMSAELEAGAQVAQYRRVNEQARGELAGQKTAVNVDSRYIATELVSQQLANAARRVPGETGGALAGQKSNITVDSRHIISEQAAQSDVNVYRRVNEQARGELAGQRTAVSNDSQFIVTAKNNQAYQATVARVNEQLRGEYVGQSTYDHRSRGMIAERAAGKMNSDIHRVNEQARGEFAGKKTSFDHQSVEMMAYRSAQNRASQDKREVAGMFGHISRDTIADARYHAEEEPHDYIAVCGDRSLSMKDRIKQNFEDAMSPPKLPQTRTKLQTKRTSLV
eukprot:m.190773 g.190773  ORF g.190773 m.190773 type:complete len:586 (-) comp24896_c0_seq3:194-1951(-)